MGTTDKAGSQATGQNPEFDLFENPVEMLIRDSVFAQSSPQLEQLGITSRLVSVTGVSRDRQWHLTDAKPRTPGLIAKLRVHALIPRNDGQEAILASEMKRFQSKDATQPPTPKRHKNDRPTHAHQATG